MNIFFDEKNQKINTLGWIFLISFFAKMILAQLVPFSSDEAYYWVWGQRLQLSYFDHPPMVAWLFSIGEALNQFHITPRWPFAILGHLSLLIWLQILKGTLNQQQLLAFAFISICGLLTGFGSIIGTPDVPVMFFWSLSVFAFIKYLSKPSFWLASLIGAILGLGFCAKYHIVLLVPCFITYLFVTKQFSRIKVTHWLGLIFFGLVFCSPVLWWNYQNDFMSFKFQLQHGFAERSWNILDNLHFLVGQFVLVSPAIAIAAFLTMKAESKQKLLLTILTAIPFGFFFIASFRGTIEANWTIIGHYSLFALAASQVPRFKKSFTVSNIVWLVLIGATLFHYIKPYPNMARKIDEPLSFKRAMKLADGLEPIYGSNYQLASFLWYSTKKPHYKLYAMSRFDLFDSWPESKPTADLFYVIAPFYTGEIPEWVRQAGYQYERLRENEEYIVFKVSKI